MIHQVMMSGSLKKGVPKTFQMHDIKRIFQHVSDFQYTGLTLYTDGSYTTIYEGKLSLIEASILAYTDTPRYDNIMKLYSRAVEARSFQDFRIGLRGQDAGGGVLAMENCFGLQAETFKDAIPKTLPKEFVALFKSFARVNNLRGV